MFALSAVLLLVGGGLFPPIFAMLVSLVANRIHSPLTWWRAHLSASAKQNLAKLWPWSFAVGALAWPTVFPISYLWGENAAVILAALLLALGGLILTIFAGFARDIAKT